MMENNIPFLAPLPPAILAGRDRELAALKALLAASDPPAVIVLGYLPGVGKTALAAQLVQEDEILDRFTGGVLWAALGPEPELPALLAEWLVALGFELPQIARMKSLDDRLAAIRERASREPMLLVLDDVWGANDVRPFILGGPGSVHLITTRNRQVASDLDGTIEFEVRELDEHAGLEVLEQLAPEAVKMEPDQAVALVSAVGGLPLGLVLMGKYLWTKSNDGMPRRVRRALDELKNAQQRLQLETHESPYFQPSSHLADVPLSLMSSIQVSDEALDPGARHTLRKLATGNNMKLTFSSEFAENLGTETFQDIETLFTAGLIEEDLTHDERRQRGLGSGPVDLERVLRTTGAEPQKQLFRIPRTIADYARVQVNGQLDEAELEEFHRQAAEYYQGWLRSFEETHPDATPFLRQFRYVHPRWLTVMSNLLSHLSFTRPADANLKLARLYFDAFWWWGCYIPFPFCEELLEQWQAKRTSPEDQQWLDLMNTFHRSYPTGYEKYGKGDWAAVEQALVELRALGDLEGDWVNLDPERQHVRGITNMFLAESRRYRDTSDLKADDYYEEALAIFTAGEDENPDDAWNVPWVLWHQGDLFMERGQPDRSFPKVIASREKAVLASAEDERARDNEIISNDFRVEADLYWQQGDLDRAFDRYTTAALYAYLFLGCPLPPNFYTVEFYREMTTRTLQRLQQLWEQDRKDQALRAVSQLRAFWSPYWQTAGDVDECDVSQLLDAADLDGVAHCFFPPFPTAEEMLQGEDSGYVARVLQTFDCMHDRLHSKV